MENTWGSDNARAVRLYEKYGFRKLCTFPCFFKINGENIDFDRMNLELNTMGDHGEEKYDERNYLCLLIYWF